MDHSNIPTCALYRNTGTVIVRLKMDVTTTCCRHQVCPPSGCPELLHRPSGCEQCNRTRIISQYSDCDSGVVEKCQPYRASAARSRYVNVCAAVCLLLLVGSLSPKSSAAPHRTRATMERERRAADEERRLWANPCDYNDSNSNPPNHEKELALRHYLATQAKNSFQTALAYKDSFTKRHSYPNFEVLLHDWENEQWLRKFDWIKDAFPADKVLHTPLSEEKLAEIMSRIDELMPSMYKGLKMIVAGLYKFSEYGLTPDVLPDDGPLKTSINKTMHDVRAVLCYFSDIMHARNLEIKPVYDSEIPDVNDPSLGLTLYRDTLNYLEFLEQVFQKFYEQKSA